MVTIYKAKYKGRELYIKDMRPIARKILSQKPLTRIQKGKWKAWTTPPYRKKR